MKNLSAFLIALLGCSAFAQEALPLKMPVGHKSPLYRLAVDLGRNPRFQIDLLGVDKCRYPALRIKAQFFARNKKTNDTITETLDLRVDDVDYVLTKRWTFALPQSLRGAEFKYASLEAYDGQFNCSVEISNLSFDGAPDPPPLRGRQDLAEGAKGRTVGETALPLTKVARAELLKARRIGDAFGARDLIASGQMVILDPGTELLILTVDDSFAREATKSESVRLTADQLDYERCMHPFEIEGRISEPLAQPVCVRPQISEEYRGLLRNPEALVLLEVRATKGPNAGSRGWIEAQEFTTAEDRLHLVDQ